MTRLFDSLLHALHVRATHMPMFAAFAIALLGGPKETFDFLSMHFHEFGHMTLHLVEVGSGMVIHGRQLIEAV